MKEIKFLWFVVINGIEHTLNENTFDTYAECVENIQKEYPEYEKCSKIVLVEIDETEIITVLYEIK